MATDNAALLERERELAECGVAFGEARRGHGRVVLVEAPAGLGKTSLLRAAWESAAQEGFTCLRARAGELERDFAYGCMRQLLEPAVAKASDEERRRLFEGAAGLAAPLFTPTDYLRGAASADSAFSMLHGLYWLVNNLCDERPAALFLDDLHWSDTESVRFLTYLAPRLDGIPLAVVASTRSGEAISRDLARLASAPETIRLRLAPLSLEATGTLCEARFGLKVADEFAATCREATGGNPFFLEALLREAGEQRFEPDSREAARVRRLGPAAVAQAVLLRLSGKPPETTALVRAIAVLGDGAGLSEAAALADLNEEEASRAADMLCALSLLEPGLEFAHPIVREAVRADIGTRARAAAHARAAEILAEHGAAAERIAAQIAEAEPVGDAGRVELLRRVAADALARGAPSAAATLLGRALAEPPPGEAKGEVLFELGAAEQRLGRPEAVDHLTEAIELLSEPADHAIAVRQLAHSLTQTGRPDRAVEAIESAIAVVEPRDREQALLLEAELGYHAQHAGPGSWAPAARRLERHSDLEGATPGERIVLAGLACERARHSQSASEATRYLEEALAGWRLPGEQQLNIVGVFYDITIGLLAADALDVADRGLEQALADARARASIPEVAYATCWRGWVSLRRGAVGQAEADARTALELVTTHNLLGIRFALALLVGALVEAGDRDAAEYELRASGVGDGDFPPSRASNYLLASRGRLHLAQGRTREGLADLLEFGRRDELLRTASQLASRWRSHAAPALAALGEREEALAMAREDLERARRWGTPGGIGMALRAHALVPGDAAPVDGLREAARMLEESPARLEQARALVDLGAALRRARRRAEARDALQGGLDLAERCGARGLAATAQTELRAAGGRSSVARGAGPERLTASELRVAELAAEGRSNPEIAQELFVTRKTVETHLGHIYRKLDVSGRGELAAALTG